MTALPVFDGCEKCGQTGLTITAWPPSQKANLSLVPSMGNVAPLRIELCECVRAALARSLCSQEA